MPLRYLVTLFPLIAVIAMKTTLRMTMMTASGQKLEIRRNYILMTVKKMIRVAKKSLKMRMRTTRMDG